MSYNIEDHEDDLKNEMPFKMNDEQWESMQQRIKDKVLGGNTVALPKKKRTFNIKAAVGIAAGVALVASLFLPQSKFRIYSRNTENAEQQLDKTIGGLNEDELYWMQQLNENEISEQDQYLENEVEL